MITRSPFAQTPDLSEKVLPQPKQFKAKKQPKAMNKIGKKTEANMEATAELVKTAVKLGFTRCEVQLEGCWKVVHGFVHGKKRRKLTLTELKKFAIGGCNPCHEKVEYDCEKWTGMTMEQFVRHVIKNRKKVTK